MKGLKVFTAILVVQVLLIGALLVWPHLPVSKAVNGKRAYLRCRRPMCAAARLAKRR